ncbi:MAG TPA: hypothetical protein VFW90_01885 [Candidatus Saccharimonadales bacterium]|nr:hypothetical protein [Candidatus Saccharimonadales bacterium]
MGTKTKIDRGDTIVEVLIAIAIASFAIGISYATAHRSLNQAITARERNQALNLIENQIAALKLRYQKQSSGNFAQFTLPANHFCLDDTASDPTAAGWAPYSNYNSDAYLSANLKSSSSPSATTPYNVKCGRSLPNDGANYFLDIRTTSSAASSYPTIYQVIARWSRIDGGQTNQASIYYRF